MADFFVERFRSVQWIIVTPVDSVCWGGETLSQGPPGRRSDVPATDAFEAGWRGHYESMFNPVRANANAMRAGMAKKFWRNLPDTAMIPERLQSAPSRTEAMLRRTEAPMAMRPPQPSLARFGGKGRRRLVITEARNWTFTIAPLRRWMRSSRRTRGPKQDLS